MATAPVSSAATLRRGAGSALVPIAALVVGAVLGAVLVRQPSDGNVAHGVRVGGGVPQCSAVPVAHASAPLPPTDPTKADAASLPLTYLTPDFFPYPRVPLVMETTPGTCDLFWRGGAVRPNPCDKFSERRIYEPDPHNREAIATALHHCRYRACHSVDIGANIGYITAFMAMLGSTVIAVEPQLDLARALAQTVLVNGWQDRVTVHAGFAAMEEVAGTRTMGVGMGWRFVNDGIVTPWDAPFINMAAHMVAARVPTFDLVKVDTDSVDGPLLAGLLRLLRSGAVNVTTIITEFTGGTAAQLFDFQQLGYTIYRLNVHMLLRLFDSTGADRLAHFGPVQLPPLTEERFFVRYMKYALKVLPAARAEELEPLARGTYCPGGCVQFMITRLQLEEPAYVHPQDADQLRWPVDTPL